MNSTINLTGLLFKSSDELKNWPWNPNHFVLKEDLVWDSKIATGLNYTWISPDCMVEITKEGVFTIRKGYRWDGTTAVPDGNIDPNVGLPVTWKASLIHDVCCDYYDKPDFPYTFRQFNYFFYRLLLECNFKRAKLYYVGVTLFARSATWFRKLKAALGFKRNH